LFDSPVCVQTPVFCSLVSRKLERLGVRQGTCTTAAVHSVLSLRRGVPVCRRFFVAWRFLALLVSFLFDPLRFDLCVTVSPGVVSLPRTACLRRASLDCFFYEFVFWTSFFAKYFPKAFLRSHREPSAGTLRPRSFRQPVPVCFFLKSFPGGRPFVFNGDEQVVCVRMRLPCGFALCRRFDHETGSPNGFQHRWYL